MSGSEESQNCQLWEIWLPGDTGGGGGWMVLEGTKTEVVCTVRLAIGFLLVYN